MKNKTNTTILVILIGLLVFSGIAFSTVKAQAPETEETLPEPNVTTETVLPSENQIRFEIRDQLRAERRAQRQFQSEDCICIGLSAEECDAVRLEHRLARLDERLAQGLITQEHYDYIRAKIEAGEQPPFGLHDGSGMGLGSQGQGNGQGTGNGQGMRRGQGNGQGGGRRGQQNNGECPYIP